MASHLNARIFIRSKLALAIGAALLTMASPAFAQKTVRAVLGSNILVLDPIVSTSYSSRTFGFLVYDTLFARDSHGAFKPQMLESYDVSPDGMTYTFRLRAGLKWHDGSPVRAQDCVASIQRWAQRDGLGRQMMNAAKELVAKDDSTFTLTLAKPFGLVIETLGKESVNVPFMMPEKLTKTSPNVAITETNGSGPFIFKKDEFIAGNVAVFVKNPNYVPRNEPADGMAGGKVVKVDRVEIKWIPDPSTQVAALSANEVDYIEYTPLDLIPVLQADPKIEMRFEGPNAQKLGWIRPNHLQPPFDNPKARLALLYAINRREILSALGDDPKLTNPDCDSFFACKGPYEAKVTEANRVKPDMAKAKELLKESGYKGEKVVLMTWSDNAVETAVTPVIVDQLRQAGFVVEVQEMEQNSLLARRNSKASVDKGGWSLFSLHLGSTDLDSPATHLYVANNCNPEYAGWSCDERIRDLINKFIAESDYQKRREIATEVSDATHVSVPALTWGSFVFPVAMRTSLKGMLPGTPSPVFWNVEKQ